MALSLCSFIARAALGHQGQSQEQDPFYDRHHEQDCQPQWQAGRPQAFYAKCYSQPKERQRKTEQHRVLAWPFHWRKAQPWNRLLDVAEQRPVATENQLQEQPVNIVFEREQQNRPKNERPSSNLAAPTPEPSEVQFHKTVVSPFGLMAFPQECLLNYDCLSSDGTDSNNA